jgi:hypothetical protein
VSESRLSRAVMVTNRVGRKGGKDSAEITQASINSTNLEKKI